MSISRFLIPLLAVISVILGSCTGTPEFRYASGSVWGTTYHIKYCSDTDLSDSIVSVMHRVDMSLSPFQKGSLISAINSGEDVVVDKMLSDVFSLSQEVCRLSGGAFDPTLAPLINLWGFGYKGGVADVPTQAQIDEALTSVGVMDCHIDSVGRLIRKSSQTEFNFSAIAKGYGIDCIAEMLRRNGCLDYMVEIGGELALSGNGSTGDGWVIQIDAPIMESGSVSHEALSKIRVTDCGVATSGNYRNYRTTSEGSVGHTINAMTGHPVSTNTLSATVIAPTTALADALATSCMAMSCDSALMMIRGCPGAEVLLVIRQDLLSVDSMHIIHTEGFPSLIH